ncbi:hypothetical protein MLD38_023889 [Melastoma candidum]|uniref:Uncharacterized protein n=1 Tax=Melastoma candidum TaxID=119954 RepID=A0ACB9NVJ5_9MYRT|nr:hypothetical protein MLD38_023889 [Melastoma candidum]
MGSVVQLSGSLHHIDLEDGGRYDPRRARGRGHGLGLPSSSPGIEDGDHDDASDDDDGSVSFSDADVGSCYSHYYSTAGGSYDEYSFGCMSDRDVPGGSGSGSGRASSAMASECSVEVVEVDGCGVVEVKVHLAKVERERDCRICHLGLESNSHESGVPIELGCSCKDDLGAAHKNCAEAWFKIRGNKICEICNSIARNVIGAVEMETTEQSANEVDNPTASFAAIAASAPSERRHFWQGHRFLNFLLACMIFAFVISWLFHFNVPST